MIVVAGQLKGIAIYNQLARLFVPKQRFVRTLVDKTRSEGNELDFFEAQELIRRISNCRNEQVVKLRQASVLLKQGADLMLERAGNEEPFYVHNFCGRGLHTERTEPDYGDMSYADSVGEAWSEEECFAYFSNLPAFPHNQSEKVFDILRTEGLHVRKICFSSTASVGELVGLRF